MKLWQAWKYRNVDLRVARRVTEAVENGEVILTVPKWLAAEASQWIWVRKVEHAGEKWADRVAEVTPEVWKQSAYRHLPRQEGRDD